ncbi:MAG: CRISPR-associated protein Csx3, partial [Desulfobulbaceae bacterium]
YRRKGEFAGEIVEWYAGSLARCDLAPIILVDIGGRITEENRRILCDGRVDAAIILSGTPERIPEWGIFLAELGIPVFARIVSEYPGTADRPDASPMVVHYLERGEDVSCRPTIQKIAAMLLDMAGDKKKEEKSMNYVLSIPHLAAALGKNAQQTTLPNGRVVNQVVWQGEDLPALAKILHNKAAEIGPVVDIDGAAPAWLVAALCHMVHPTSVRVNSPDGYVAIGQQKPADTPAGKNLDWDVQNDSQGWTVVTCQMTDPSIPLSPADLDGVIPPAVPFGARVIISGRIPNWLTATLAMAYHGRAKAVALFQPGIGATVAWTHSRYVPLGTLIS